LHVGGVVLGDDIAAGHTVATEVAGRAGLPRPAESRFANVYDRNSELRGAGLNDLVAALHRHGRQEDAVGKIFEVVVITADADLGLNLVVIGLKVGVVDGPVFAG